MRTTDWNFDFASLPRWDNRERIFYVYDEFYEIPGKDMLCCIYSVAEVSMLNHEGFLAILRNKEKPELVLNAADICFCVNFSQSADGRFLFLQPSFYFPKKGYRRPVLILDMEKNRFAYVVWNDWEHKAEVRWGEAPEERRKAKKRDDEADEAERAARELEEKRIDGIVDFVEKYLFAPDDEGTRNEDACCKILEATPKAFVARLAVREIVAVFEDAWDSERRELALSLIQNVPELKSLVAADELKALQAYVEKYGD
jgi:hypothetical protein